MASNPYVNKVEYGGSTVMDITDTTATASDVASGKVFYAASGARSVGTASSGGGLTIDDIYPVGSIYMSVSSTDPATLFGGTWAQIQDTFLLAAGATYAGGTSGGEASHHHGTKGHKLTAAESGVPAHIHETANSMVVYNNASSVSTRMATSGSGTKISLNTALANNLNTYQNTAAAASSAHTHGDTEDTTTLPPYLAVYVWQRTA